MKKNLFFYAAAAALMLTACTNEDDVVQVEQTVTTAENDGGVGFDVYLPGATQSTRGGRTNVINTSVLQQTGFGVFGYVSEDNHDFSPSTTDIPNFMWNQQVFYNKTASAWYYSPLKYWPNETKIDSQTSPASMPDVDDQNHLDKVSFFAYAPWVRATKGDGDAEVMNAGIDADDAVGITKMTAGNGTFMGSAYVQTPKIHYVVATDPDNSVDLLWGVAPVGGLHYTAVNTKAVDCEEGTPLINLTKPAVNTNLKFLFQHALARLSVKVVLASDKVAAGGEFDYGNTKVTIEKIEINGNFGTEGNLLLNNTQANVARWENVTTAASTPFTIEAGKGLAPHLVYNATLASAHSQQQVTGVTTELADAIKVSTAKDAVNHDYTREHLHTGSGVTPLTYSATTPYFDSWIGNNGDNYVDFTESFTLADNTTYFQMSTTELNDYTDSKAFNIIKVNGTGIVADPNILSIKYPNATVWKNIYSIANDNIYQIASESDMISFSTLKAYRLSGLTLVPTGQNPQIGDYVFKTGTNVEVAPGTVPAPTHNATRYTAVPNYFMVIPTNYISSNAVDRTVDVKITYWVSTKDANLTDGIVYTKNVVEKTVELPSFKNGMAYNLKLILGLTSVKIEAEMEEWQTMTQEINLPQNTSE